MADEPMTLSEALNQYFNGIDMSELEGQELPAGMEMEDLRAFIGIIGLPDAEFEIIAPMMLENMERSLRDPAVISEYVSQIKAGGGSVEDIINTKDEIVNSFKDIEGISQPKIDFLTMMFDIYANAAADYIGTNFITVPIQLMSEDVKLPEYAHLTDSGMDVYALEDITIGPGETKLVPTGIKVAIPEGYEIQVRPKSGRCLKTKLRIANTPGTIDAGYRDEIGVIIDNIDPVIKGLELDDDGRATGFLYGSSYTIGKGEKFAQLVLVKVPHIQWSQVEDINLFSGDRGGGFGSTGTK